MEEQAGVIDIENSAALLVYLRHRGIVDYNEAPDVRVLKGGVSNRVVLVKPKSAKPFVLKQALRKLRVDVDWFCTPERVQREALAIRYLAGITPAGTVPRVVFEDSEQYLYAMEEVPEPHRNWKEMLLGGELVQSHVEQFAFLLGTIHKHSSGSVQELTSAFGDRSIFDILRLEPYYRYTASRIREAERFLDALASDTLSRQISLVHGDYSPKNILIYEGRLALLDCEVVHLGDPAFDIGFSMTHFLSKANHLKAERSSFSDAAIYYWTTYSGLVRDQPWHPDLEARAVRHTLGCCLARVAGRSPLEYLSEPERTTQRSAVLSLLASPPATIPELVYEFTRRLS